MMISQWLTVATTRLQEAGVASARLDAEVLLAHALGKNRTWLHAHGDETLENTVLQHADEYLQRRLKREPVAYITGKKEFYGREFMVTPDVLVPRPETEALVDLAKSLSLPEYSYVIDVGTGSGVIGLTLAVEIPRIYDMILVDISDKALSLAKHNNRTLFHKRKVQYYSSDLLSFWHSQPPQADLVVANLPYVDKTWQRSPETDHEPALALFADDGGLALIKTLIAQATTVLKPGGYLLLEADPEQHSAIAIYAASHNYEHHLTDGYATSFVKLP